MDPAAIATAPPHPSARAADPLCCRTGGALRRALPTSCTQDASPPTAFLALSAPLCALDLRGVNPQPRALPSQTCRASPQSGCAITALVQTQPQTTLLRAHSSATHQRPPRPSSKTGACLARPASQCVTVNQVVQRAILAKLPTLRAWLAKRLALAGFARSTKHKCGILRECARIFNSLYISIDDTGFLIFFWRMHVRTYVFSPVYLS